MPQRVKQGKGKLAKLRRFDHLTPKLKSTLIKTLFLSVLEYPPILLCSLSKTQKTNIQIIVNKGIRFINHNDPDMLTVKEVHEKFNIAPFNISIHTKALKIWETIELTAEHLYTELIRPRDNKHNWLPRTSDTRIIHAPPLVPIFTS